MMINSDAKDRFWQIVEECLIMVHGLHQDVARRKSVDLRERLESPPTGMSSDMFYHAEPFDVACDIAKQARRLSDYRDKDAEILSRHNW
jgi:hypothetical protein